MKFTRRLGLLASALVLPLLPACSAAQEAPAPASVAVKPAAMKTAVGWKTQRWSSAFKAKSYRLAPAPQIDFAGHPLDVEYDRYGAAWTVGEFGQQLTRIAGGKLTRINVPRGGGLSEPHASSWGGHSTSSELVEAVEVAGDSVWATYGGTQNATAPLSNHSLLVRVSTRAPFSTCVVPLPGGNNEVIGLAYDPKRKRVYFAEAEGDHLVSGAYSKIGWVKASGLGSRCQNNLNYGRGEDAATRARAQASINGLACTPAQERSATANCVHTVTRSMPTGAAHLSYDAFSDALWVSNWARDVLTKIDLKTNNVSTYPLPSSGMDWPLSWRLAVERDAVYLNQYNANRLLRFDKRTAKWSTITVPVAKMGGSPSSVQTHSIIVAQGRLYFTIGDEDYAPGKTALGYVDLAQWKAGRTAGVLYTGWETLPMHRNAPAKNEHSLRGLAMRGKTLAVTDHGDMATVVLIPR